MLETSWGPWIFLTVSSSQLYHASSNSLRPLPVSLTSLQPKPVKNPIYLPCIVAIVLCPVVVDDPVKVIVAHGALLLAGDLDSLLDADPVVALFEIHHPFAEDEPFQVDDEDLWQGEDLSLFAYLAQGAAVTTLKGLCLWQDFDLEELL